MTDNCSRYCDNISEKLAFYVALIRQENSNNMQSRNIRAEGFFAAFLNTLKGWDLKNANDEQQNAPGIDLIDRKNRVIVQVSSTFDREKILKSLKKSDKSEYQGYHFYFMAITDKVKAYADFPSTAWIEFDQKKDIYDTGKLLEMVKGKTPQEQEALSKLVDAYFTADRRAALRRLTRMPARADTGSVICRDTELKKVLEMLREGRDVLLMSGFGGIGKTSLARLVFYTVLEEYEEVAWIEYSGSLKNSMVAQIELGGGVLPPEDRWQIIQNLERDGLKKLIVVDNADHDGQQDPRTDEDLEALSRWSDTSVIVTSRLDELGPYSLYEIDFLGEDPCIDLFYHYYDPLQKKDPARTQLAAVKKLVELAQYHTLTVELFARGAKRKADLESYYQTLSKDLCAVPRQFTVTRTGKMATIEGHLRALFVVQGRTEEEKRILWSFAVLPPNAALTVEEAEKWFGFSEAGLDPLAEDGWLRWKDDRYAMHPLMRQIIRLDKVPKGTAEHFLAFMEDESNGFFPRVEVYTERIRRMELAQAVMEAVDQERVTVQVGNILHNLGDACWRLAWYDNAVDYYNKSLAIKKVKLGEDHLSTASTYHNLALIYRYLDALSMALEYYDMALQIRLSKLGIEHNSTLQTINNIAEVYRAMGNLPMALEYHIKALEIREQILEKNHPDLAATYNNLGRIYLEMCDFPKALEYHKKALAIREPKLGKDHPDTATTYNNLAMVYQAKRDFQIALKYYKKAMEAKETLLGNEHPSTVTTYHNIGSLYYEIELYPDAVAYLLQAFRIRLVKLGYRHRYTKDTYDWLSAAYQAQHGETESFLPWLRGQLNEEENRALDELLKE